MIYFDNAGDKVTLSHRNHVYTMASVIAAKQMA